MTLLEKNLPEKFRAAEEKVSQEWGAFHLFALIERQETPGQWDLVVSAPWIEADRKSIAHFVTALSPGLNNADWLTIARVVPLKATDAFVQSVATLYPAEHELREIPTGLINGIHVNHAFIITANNRLVPMTEHQPVAA